MKVLAEERQFMGDSSTQPFRDRREAGHLLAQQLKHYAGRPDVIVLGLPRGGVPIAFEVAKELVAPLDVFLVRKLGLPGQPELAMGAIASDNVRVLNDDVVRWSGVPERVIDAVAKHEQAELERRERRYRHGRGPLKLQGQVVILVDDGLATGSTMQAAVRAVRESRPARIVVAAPVGAQDSCQALAKVADEVICARRPERFNAVGQWYLDFSETSDDEVVELLAAQPSKDTVSS